MADLDGMVVFARVVEAGSFVGAARALGMPTSTVSRRLAALEHRLGVRLLERTTRRVRPTDEGRAFYDRVAPVVRDAAEAERAVRDLQTTPSGLVRVVASRLFVQHFLAPVAIEYMATWPETALEVVAGDPSVDLVGEGFDLAIRGGDLDDSSLVARRLGAGHSVLCASPAYVALRGVPATPEALVDHDCARYAGGPEPDRWRFEAGPDSRRTGGAVTVAVRGRLRVNEATVARQAALAGLCVVRLPAFLCSEDLRAGRLVPLLPEWRSAPRWIHAVYPSRRHLSVRVRAFVDLLVARLGDSLSAPAPPPAPAS